MFLQLKKELEAEKTLKLAKREAVRMAGEEEIKLTVANVEAQQSRLEVADKKLKAAEAHLSLALKELNGKEQKLKFNVELAHCEINEYKQK